MSYQPPPQYPPGQPPPGQYPPPGYPQGPYDPGQYGQAQYPPGQYPPGQGPPQGQPVQQRRGCRGCLFGCLITSLILAVLIAVVVAAGAYTIRQMFPTTESVQEAAGCVVMRVFANNLESILAQSDLTEAEKQGMRRELEQLRREFEGQCGT